jgi:hypothetical protein
MRHEHSTNASANRRHGDRAAATNGPWRVNVRHPLRDIVRRGCRPLTRTLQRIGSGDPMQAERPTTTLLESKMNVRKSLTIVSFAALAPLSAFAGGPSGEYWDRFSDATPAAEVADTREEHRNYVEFTVEQLVAESSKGHAKSREEVRQELAAMPMPRIEA